MIATRRIYEPATRTDGYRVLVDRLWPRGVSKARARLDRWAREVAPSDELRAWYGHEPARWPEFRRRYRQELRRRDAAAVLDELLRRAKRGRVTLLYAAEAGEISNAAALASLLNRRLARARAKR